MLPPTCHRWDAIMRPFHPKASVRRSTHPRTKIPIVSFETLICLHILIPHNLPTMEPIAPPAIPTAHPSNLVGPVSNRPRITGRPRQLEAI